MTNEDPTFLMTEISSDGSIPEVGTIFKTEEFVLIITQCDLSKYEGKFAFYKREKKNGS